MTQTTTDNSQAVQLKADLVAMTVLQINEASLDSIEKQLTEATAQAPAYFKGAPIIIDISKIPVTLKDFVDLKAIHELLLNKGLCPVGVRGTLDKQDAVAKSLGLVKLNARVASNNNEANQPPKAAPASKKAQPAVTKTNSKPAEPATAKAPAMTPRTKVITKPVRSGMQVYAKDGDLMILSTVNPGAEVIADGNIYIFGALKGRALAGAKGNKQAKIMCQSLDAELVAIAGQYLTKETLGNISQAKGMLHIYLNDKQLMIEPT